MARDLLAGLLALRGLPRRRVVGLMSGTSADGIDAAVVEITGHGVDTKVEQLAFATLPLDTVLKQRIWGLPDGVSGSICELNFMLGEAFAQAVFAAAASIGLPLGELHLVGSHGQTARHQPLGPGRTRGSTLQIGEGAVIAERTGLPVICDFRVADVAAGGQGAPLIPLVDYLLFREPDRVRATLNLGGIANVTVVDPDPARVTAFDTGPANMALDAVARAASSGTLGFDRDARLARRGEVDQTLLGELMSMPYLAQRPPKSTGREMFGRDFVYPLLDQFREHLDDLAATLTHFTAESVGLAFDRFVLPEFGEVSDVLVSGGGVHNPLLLELITRRLAPLKVTSVADEGINPDAKEAIGFAVLANESLFSGAGNIPHATGARGPRVLGKFVLPPPR
jgi:anhydro-N-acetylmuramic acid kinase